MIQIDELRFSYRGRCVYDGLSLELKDGAVYGLLGRNGAGKTTLMRLIAGLLRCGNGRIEVDGMVPFDRKPEFLDNVYFVPESFNAPDLPVIEYAGNYGMFYSNYDGDALVDYLRIFDVEPGAVFRRLSSGQKKKAMIAFALSLNTRLLLLDEPGNGLDIPSKLTLRRLLAEHMRPDRTVILSTHQVREVEDIVDHVAVIDSGRLLLNSSLDDLAGKICFSTGDKVMLHALFSERTAAGVVNILPRLTRSGIVSGYTGHNLGSGTLSDRPTAYSGTDTETGTAADAETHLKNLHAKTDIDMEVLFDACISGGGTLVEYLRSLDRNTEKEVDHACC